MQTAHNEALQHKKMKESSRQCTNITASEELLRLLDIPTQQQASASKADSQPDDVISPTTPPSAIQRSYSLPSTATQKDSTDGSDMASFKVNSFSIQSVPDPSFQSPNAGPSYSPYYMPPMIDNPFCQPSIPLPPHDILYQHRSPTPMSDSCMFSQVCTLFLLPTNRKNI